MTLDRGTAIGDVKSPLIYGLVCAALQPGLRSVLVFDSSPQALRSAANVLTEMLKVTSDRAVEQITLGRTDSEETLWGTLALKSSASGESFDWEPGLLGAGLKVVVIPDLMRLNLVAARACIALMGTEIAQVERRGHQAQWRSEICWIAGCARSEIGMVSPHLLDRFALRLPGQEIQSIDRTDALSAWFADLDAVPEEVAILSAELCDHLRAATLIHPTIAADAYERALAYFSDGLGMGMRRELALMRFAQARSQENEFSAIIFFRRFIAIAS
jgi:magnesium chelatase subunit D